MFGSVPVTNSSATPSKRLERSEKRGMKRTVEEMLRDTNEDKENNQELQQEVEKLCVIDEEHHNEEELRQKVKRLEKENLVLRETIKSYKNSRLASTQKETESELNAKIQDTFKSIFSKTQLDAIITKKNVKNWTDDDIASAYTLRSLSPKCYAYLRTVKRIPLPCVSTLNARAKKFEYEPGLLYSALSLMKSNTQTLSTEEKLTVVSIDEMSIAKEWSYDKGTDTLYKPHERVQIVMLRGLIGKWKQPIYYQFDESNMQKILVKIIENVEGAGYPVVALVHDLRSTNLRIWKEFGIDIEKR